MSSNHTIEHGQLLTVCSEAGSQEELQRILIEKASDTLNTTYLADFRAAFTGLLQAEEESKERIMHTAGLALQKVRDERKDTKRRIWGEDADQKAAQDSDPELEEGMQREINELKEEFRREMAAVLKELQIKSDSIGQRFASIHFHVVCNARAITEYLTGFEDSPPLQEPNIDDIVVE